VFWSQALTSQSAPSAAGSVPPITQPKNRPEGIAIRPGSMRSASRSMTAAGSVGPSGRSPPSAATMSSQLLLGGTVLLGTSLSQARAWAAARSRTAS
jgi:hypothetical protein